MATEIKVWLDFAIQQMAAESYLDQFTVQGAPLQQVLVDGNNDRRVIPLDQFTGKTQFANLQAQQFTTRYQILDHHANDATGFSATLMKDTQTGEYTLSFRSTEFLPPTQGGDWERDGIAGADGEIVRYGFSLAQLVSMEKYYQELKANPAKLPAGAVLNVTGYSLGGHLATVFTELHDAEVTHTYTFNGAGRGTIVEPGQVGQPEVQSIRRMLQDLDARIQTFDPTGAFFHNGAAGNIYQDDRYQNALLATRQRFTTVGTAAIVSTSIDQGAFRKITQLHGSAVTGSDFEFVANSGLHARPTPVLIEGQPNWEGQDAQGQLQQGNTHSLTLLVDSLALQDLFHTVDPTLTQAQIEGIFKAASNATAQRVVASPNTPDAAEGDTMEKSLDALRRLFLGPHLTPPTLPSDSRGGGFGNLPNRNLFYDSMAAVRSALPGHTYQIVSLVSMSVETVKGNALLPGDAGIAYRYALKELNPFAVIGANYSQFHNPGDLDLYDPETGNGTITLEYLTDRASFLGRKVEFNLNNGSRLVDQFNGIHWKDYASGYEINPGVVFASTPREYLFGGQADDTLTGNIFADRLYGGDGVDTIEGNASSDYIEGNEGNDVLLSGGSGNDTILGGQGDDTLDGGTGNDTLDGGLDNDILRGGTGVDIYLIGSNDGADTIEDADGKGMIKFDGQVLVGALQRLGNRSGVFHSADGTITFTKNESTHDVVVTGSGPVTIKNFTDGQFGMRLVALPTFAEATRTEFLKVDHYVQVGNNPDGSPILEPAYAPFFDDNANNTSPGGGLTQPLGDENNLIYAGGGDDSIGVPTLTFPGPYLPGDDQLYGEGGQDTIYAGLGQDRVFGGDGDDDLYGDSYWAELDRDGSDYLDGGAGSDWIDGADGSDILLGGGGRDVLFGDHTVLFTAEGVPYGNDHLYGNDYLDGGDEDDELHGEGGADVLIGGAGNDFLLGDLPLLRGGSVEAGGDDVLDGGTGNDQLYGVYGDDLLSGGDGQDVLNGQDGHDVLHGGADDDWLSGDLRLVLSFPWGTLNNGYGFDTSEYQAAGGDDVLIGEEGDDFLIGGEGSDTLNGGEDNDVLFGGYNMGVVSTTDPLYWMLFTAAGQDWLDAGAGADVVHGSTGADTLFGGEGNDVLHGAGGDDVVEGGIGDDVLYGDYFEGEYLPSHPFYADILALAGRNTLEGGAGNDELYGGVLADVLIGGDGHDRLIGGRGADILLGDAGNDRILDDDPAVVTMGDDETLNGGDGNDYLESWWGDDVLLGGSGDDVLLSRAGTDSLSGGEGNDYLVWDNATSATTQVLSGGQGDDVYQLATAGAVVMEMAGEGIDLVITNEVGYVLPAHIENFAGGTGIGNALDNVMTGWNLEGREGNDILVGMGRLDGGSGDDLLQSGWIPRAGYSDGVVIGSPDERSAVLQPLPHPKPTEPDWYVQEPYPNTAFSPGNTYVFGSGYGHDTIDEMDITVNAPVYQNEDTVEFLSGVAPSDVTWVRYGNDLELSINGGTDRLTIQSFYDLTFYRGGYGMSGLWAPPEGYAFQSDFDPSAGFPSYIAYSRVERFTFADGTVWTADHFGAPLLGDYQSDTYQFGRGSGQVRILDFDLWPSSSPDKQIDTVRVGAGVTSADLEVFQNGNNLILAIKDTEDYVTVQSFFSSVRIAPPVGNSYYALPYQIERVQFDDGTVWTVGDLYAHLSSSDRFSTIVGTANADTLSGDIRNNVIYGLDGNDSLYGGGGHDALYGGAGNDYLQGAGNDHDGGDYFEGGSGNDSLLGYDGGNTYVFRRGDGQDVIGSYDPDHGAADTLIFADLLPTDLTVRQSFFGNSGTSNLELVVNGSSDSLTLGNWVEWRASDIPYDPNFETELIQFADGTLWTTADVIAHAQGVTRIGSDADESFYGSVFNDVLRGQGGTDFLYGDKGNDLLDGGSGGDVLVGGFGDDTYVFGVGSGTDWIEEDLYWYPQWGTPKPNDVDAIQLSAEVTPASIALHIDLNSNLVVTIVGTTDQLTISNFWGDETREIEQIVFADGTAWDTVMIQSLTVGRDIVGTADGEYLGGSPVADSIAGLAGDDWLYGWGGADQLLGGSGDDIYEFLLGDGIDTIEDTAIAGEGNRILFGTGLTQANLTFTQDPVARTLTIQVGSSGTDKLVLTNFDPTGSNGSLVVETLAFDDGSTMALADLLAPVANQSPTVTTPLADQTASEDAPFSFTIPADTFTDPDAGDSLTYNATLADGTAVPAWLSFDPITRTFSGTPTNSEVGTLSLAVTATDAGGLSATSTFGLTVQNVNDAPTVVTPLADQTILEDVPFSFQVPTGTFADADAMHGDSLTYSATLADGSPLPVWLTFDPLARTFSGIPLNGDVGTLSLAVTATDIGGLSATSTFGLTVQNVNDAPIVVVPIPDQTGAEDEVFSFTVPTGTFADEDAVHGDTLSYRASLSDGAALPTWLSFDPITRTFSGTPGAGTAGTLQLAVTATDAGALTATDVFALTLSGPLPKTVIGTAGNDGLTGARGDDTLLGLGGNDTLSGKEGHDWLDGGTGSDTLVGGTGNDTYVVDAIGDAVTELANEGLDTVRTSLTSYTLGANVENLTLTGNVSSFGVGNVLNNILVGDAGSNVLSGSAGDDVLQGGAGSDALAGGTGADTLQGGDGDDALAGGTGNDLYHFFRGDDRDVIQDRDTAAGNQDRLAFGMTITPLDLIVERQANDLRLRVYGSGDQVLIGSWYSTGTVNQIETIQAGNGETLLNTQVNQLIQAMAGFTQQTGLSWDAAAGGAGTAAQQAQFQGILAANWQ